MRFCLQWLQLQHQPTLLLFPESTGPHHLKIIDRFLVLAVTPAPPAQSYAVLTILQASMNTL